MQTGKKRTSRFTSAVTAGGMILSNLAGRLQAKRLKWYNTIDFLPVRNFYMILETGDKRWLLKLSDYEHLPKIRFSLEPVWAIIWDEFLEVSQDRDYQIYFQKLKRYYELISRFEILKAEVFSLHFRLNLEYVEDLKKDKIIIRHDNIKNYRESLAIADKRLKNYQTRITLLEKELESKTTKGAKGHFEDLVSMVERHRGLPIDIDRLSTKRFILMLHEIQQQNGKGKDRGNRPDKQRGSKGGRVSE